MIDHLRRIFLKSRFTYQHKFLKNCYDPKSCYIILLCKGFFYKMIINISLNFFGKPLRSPLTKKNMHYINLNVFLDIPYS